MIEELLFILQMLKRANVRVLFNRSKPFVDDFLAVR
jgi:hypothetical protein